MFSCKSIYPLPRDGAPFAHFNGDHDDVFRYKSNYQKTNWVEQARKFPFGAKPRPNILYLTFLQEISLPDSQTDAFEPPFFSAIIHEVLLY